MAEPTTAATTDYDAVIAGAGMAGLYLLHRCRQLGLTARAFDTADDVGGTWYWNRYPGARCDVQSIDYSYSFDPELDAEWTWSEKYATQPEILSYLGHVADRFDLRRDITFGTGIEAARWDDEASVWHLTTSAGDEVTARHYVMATGCLSVPKDLDIPGHERFKGASYLTSKWPHEGVDFTGMRVAVIGTGSSAIQSIPIIAEQAEQLTVFQRTPNFSMPAGNGPIPEDKAAAIAADRAAYRENARWTRAGMPSELPTQSALEVSDEEREEAYEQAWARGELLAFSSAYNDLGLNEAANDTVAEFIRSKIRETVNDPDLAEALSPRTYPYGTKRPCLDTNYFETFNRDNVDLVDLRRTPLVTVTETGIDTSDASLEFDAIVYATGFDAMTGAVVSVDIEGRDGRSLKEKWTEGPRTYLGLMVEGFPNLFLITGPGSPSVLTNMVTAIEQHVEWVTDAMSQLKAEGFNSIEPTSEAEDGWVTFVNRAADITLFPKANSWYMGANVPGKPRVFLPFVGGLDVYRAACIEVAENDYLGFTRRGADNEITAEGVIRPLQLDVMAVLAAMAELDLPPLESLGADGARAFSEQGAALRPPGPVVGEEQSGTFPGADGAELSYHLYRPVTDGPHPVVVYYHGGGWVLGHATSDEPFCRDLCVRSNALIVSVDYRHAPEHRFPAAHADAYAGLEWVAENAERLGGQPGPMAVAGWSAGANLAAHVAQRATAEGGPALNGQLLVTPVTDWNPDSPSMSENAEGYILTRSMMNWFWEEYADETDRTDPRVSVLRAADLSALPPATLIAAQFDPLRDEGLAYGEAMAAAGVDVDVILAGGHLHTSLHAVDVVISGAPYRARMADALQGFFAASPLPA